MDFIRLLFIAAFLATASAWSVFDYLKPQFCPMARMKVWVGHEDNFIPYQLTKESYVSMANYLDTNTRSTLLIEVCYRGFTKIMDDLAFDIDMRMLKYDLGFHSKCKKRSFLRIADKDDYSVHDCSPGRREECDKECIKGQCTVWTIAPKGNGMFQNEFRKFLENFHFFRNASYTKNLHSLTIAPNCQHTDTLVLHPYRHASSFKAGFRNRTGRSLENRTPANTTEHEKYVRKMIKNQACSSKPKDDAEKNIIRQPVNSYRVQCVCNHTNNLRSSINEKPIVPVLYHSEYGHNEHDDYTYIQTVAYCGMYDGPGKLLRDHSPLRDLHEGNGTAICNTKERCFCNCDLCKQINVPSRTKELEALSHEHDQGVTKSSIYTIVTHNGNWAYDKKGQYNTALNGLLKHTIEWDTYAHPPLPKPKITEKTRSCFQYIITIGCLAGLMFGALVVLIWNKRHRIQHSASKINERFANNSTGSEKKPFA